MSIDITKEEKQESKKIDQATTEVDVESNVEKEDVIEVIGITEEDGNAEEAETTGNEMDAVDESSDDDAAQEIANLEKQLEEAQAKATKNMEGWQRAAADMANYKKRQEELTTRRREETISYIISQIFPALDDLDLAFQNVPEDLNENEKNWVEGFNLVQRKLIKVLEKNNVELISTEGEFDPNLHEAVTHEDSADHESNAIIAELRKGYKLGKRVLRPSLVRVAQ